MKKILGTAVVILSFFVGVCPAGSSDNAAPILGSDKEQPSVSTGPIETGIREEYLVEQKVRMLPSKHGDTIDAYMNNMVKIPMAEDLGWKVSPLEDGYEVTRSILINRTKTFEYRWRVSNSGEVTPLNDRARSLMK